MLQDLFEELSFAMRVAAPDPGYITRLIQDRMNQFVFCFHSDPGRVYVSLLSRGSSPYYCSVSLNCSQTMVDDHGGDDGVIDVVVMASGILWHNMVDGHETGPPLIFFFFYNSLPPWSSWTSTLQGV